MQKFHVITRERHGQLHWWPVSNFLFSATTPFVVLNGAEIPRAALSLPLAFLFQQGVFVPVALLGCEPGVNAFVAPDGRWLGAYLPAALQFSQFRLAAMDDGQQVLCIDEELGLTARADGMPGERFFIGAQVAPALHKVLGALAQHEQERPAMLAACALLQEHGLLRSWPGGVKTAAAEPALQDLFVIDEDVLARLPGEALARLQRAGALQYAFCQRLSMQNLPALERAGAGFVRTAMVRTPNPHLAQRLPENEAGTPSARRVLLVAYQWSTMAEMPHLVKRAGFRVDVLCPPDNPAIRNSFYDGWIDAGTTPQTLFTRLSALVGEGCYDYILLGEDPIMWKIHRERMADLLHLLPIQDPAAQSILSKVGFARFCRQNEISSPAFASVENAEMAEAALAALGLPVVVKENYSSGGDGVRIFADEQSYRRFMSAYDYAEPLLVQQFIAGELIGSEALFKHGELLMYVCSQDLGETVGPSTRRRYMPNDPAIGAMLRRIGKSARLHGFVNVGAIRSTANQQCYLFEADPRPNKWVPYSRWFGRDFSAAFRVFLGPLDDAGAVPPGDGAGSVVESGEVEFFPNHAALLLGQGRTTEAILHLLDFERNHRFTAYDPILLKDKMECLRNGLRLE